MRCVRVHGDPVKISSLHVFEHICQLQHNNRNKCISRCFLFLTYRLHLANKKKYIYACNKEYHLR